MIAVNVRLAYINKTNGDKYTKKVLAQQDTNSTLLLSGGAISWIATALFWQPARRSTILSDAKVLAENEEQIRTGGTRTLRSRLSHSISDWMRAELRVKYNENRNSSYIVLARLLTKDEISELKRLWRKTGALSGAYGLNTAICGVILITRWPAMSSDIQ